jgi:23S rRNA (uridine2552-2'-O)-methyltransferase
MTRFDPQDHYFHKAKKDWFVARSVYKLQEIDKKYHIFDKQTTTILDIWCAPWSRIQYTSQRYKELNITPTIIWFDLKPVQENYPWVTTYQQDIRNTQAVSDILASHGIYQVDCIISDMAPDTIWLSQIDAVRSINLLEETLRLYETVLKPWWKAVIKIFMGPWFDDFMQEIRKILWAKNLKTFKPKACRPESKETYIIKYHA